MVDNHDNADDNYDDDYCDDDCDDDDDPFCWQGLKFTDCILCGEVRTPSK